MPNLCGATRSRRPSIQHIDFVDVTIEVIQTYGAVVICTVMYYNFGRSAVYNSPIFMGEVV